MSIGRYRSQDRCGAINTFVPTLLLCIPLASPAAQASCGTRPGTPRDVKASALSATQVRVEWTNTTGRFAARTGLHWGEFGRIFFDMYFRDGNRNPIGRDTAGADLHEPGSYNSVTKYTFDRLAPNTSYCFALRARTEAGTQGCVSAETSNWACTTTRAR